MEAGSVLELPFAREGLFGSVTVPPSKSLAQRYLLAACLAGPPSQVDGYPDAEDPQLLLSALQEVGFELHGEGQRVAVQGFAPVREAKLFLGNNGTGLRILVAILASMPGRYVVDGVPRLRERPLGRLLAALRSLGARIEGEGLPLVIEGAELASQTVTVEARESSQFVSALLFLGAKLPSGLQVQLAGEVPSWPYVAMTAAVLRQFGAEVQFQPNSVWVKGPLQPRKVEVEGDWSAAAFPMVGVAVAGGDVVVRGLRPKSVQGDAALVDILQRAGCDVGVEAEGVRVRGQATQSLRAHLAEVPDLFPALAVLVALRGGELTGLGHLAYKESNRLQVMAERLRQVGLAVEADASSFRAFPGQKPQAPPFALSPEADHRMAMALAVAGLVTPGLRLADPQCVAKSWPDFFLAWTSLVR
ncbi:MAG: 3-phosphoshikimate 1-carboxyvinyltransferase [Thermoanaerobaculum sp.]